MAFRRSARSVLPVRGPRQHGGLTVVAPETTPRPLLQRPRTAPFISYFDKTPPGIVCPHFFVLAHANGCPFACDYCYLQLTFRYRPEPVVYSNTKKMLREIERFLDREEPSTLNAGELADALAFDDTSQLTRNVVPLFAQQRKHKLILLSKSTNVEPLLNLEHNGQTVVSFSLNASEVSAAFEHGAPPPEARIAAGRRAAEAGYPLRFRIDPIIPVTGWRDMYARLVDDILEMAPPERITIGSLRYFRSLPRFARGGKEVFRYASERDGTDNRMRVPFDLRIEAYQHILSLIPPPIGTALCKETEDAWHAIRREPRHCTCNCTL